MADKTATELEDKPIEENADPSKVSANEDNKPTVEELTAQLAETKTGMTEQIKDLRKKLQEALLVKPAEQPPTNESDVEKAVRQVLEKNRKGEAERNRIDALNRFWISHKEFHPDNDITGLKNEALMASLKRLNTTGNYSTEAILKDFEDAHRLMSNNQSTQAKSDLNKIASTTSTPGSPTTTEGSKLSPEQEKLRKEKGWTEEKYLKMKAKYPQVIL